MKAAFLDPNPCVIFEHKGLYWSKVPGTDAAKTVEPARDYLLPFGKGLLVLEASQESVASGQSLCIVTYGMGVHWALNAAKRFPGRISIIDLRTLVPLDTELIYKTVDAHGRCLVITEEQVSNSFAQSVAARIQENCFESLDAPVRTIGAHDLPAIPLNETLEKAMILSADKVAEAMEKLLLF
jgi:2-oxoisovalerate dehydrogenase E1 component